MWPRTRRSILELGGIVLGVGLSGCLSDGDANKPDTTTDTPASSETPTSPPGFKDGSTDCSWDASGAWDLELAVSNDDDRPYTVAVMITHHGSWPCHHADTTPCQAPEKSVMPFERTFDLVADKSKTFTGISLELWEDWIDDYTVQVRIENEDTTPRDRVLAYERGAKEVVGADKYERADVYVCDGAGRNITATISNGTPQVTSQ